MIFYVYGFLFLLTLTRVSSDPPVSFCLCAMKDLLEQYALFSTNQSPPRYYSKFTHDVGFFISTSTHWIPVNNATWLDFSTVINEPFGMYTRISLDGKTPLNDGLLLNGARSAYLGEVLFAYQSLIDRVNLFHENVIRSQSKTCQWEEKPNPTNVEPIFNSVKINGRKKSNEDFFFP